jgi:hypothetical protein
MKISILFWDAPLVGDGRLVRYHFPQRHGQGVRDEQETTIVILSFAEGGAKNLITRDASLRSA